MTLSDRSMCMILHQSTKSSLSSLFLIRLFVELGVGNEKKHTYLAYIAKSKTGPNRENRSYNQIKMCMCVEFCWMELAPISAWLYLLFWNMGYLSFSFSFFPSFWAWIIFFCFSFAQPILFLQHEESCQSDGVFLCGWEAYFCGTSSVEVSMNIYGV